jgi:hypothetical protein
MKDWWEAGLRGTLYQRHEFQSRFNPVSIPFQEIPLHGRELLSRAAEGQVGLDPHEDQDREEVHDHATWPRFQLVIAKRYPEEMGL